MNFTLPRSIRVLLVSVLIVVASGFVYNKSAGAFSPLDFIKQFLPGNKPPANTESAPEQLPSVFNDNSSPSPGVDQPAAPALKPELANPAVEKSSGSSNVVSPIPNLADLFKVSKDKISGQNKISTVGKIVTPVSVADLAIDTKKVQGKTVFDTKGRAILPDGAKVKGRVEFGKDLNFYINEDGYANFYNLTAENYLDVLGHIHNSKNKVVEITDPLNLTGRRLYNTLGNVVIDDNLDVSGSLGFSGPVTLNPTPPGSQGYKFYSGNIGSPIAADRLIFTDTSGGNARYWFDSSNLNTALSIAAGGNEQMALGFVTAGTTPGLGTTNFIGLYQGSPLTITAATVSGQTPLVTITNGGNVGVGTTAPTQKLDVVGNAYVEGNYLYLGGSSGFWFQDSMNSVWQIPGSGGSWQYKNSSGVVVNQLASSGSSYFNAGNVGIGTTNPQRNLSVNGGMNIDQANQNRGGLSTNSLTFGSNSSEGISSQRSGALDTPSLDFYTNSLPRIRVTNSGNVGVGNTDPSSLLTIGTGAGASFSNNNRLFINGNGFGFFPAGTVSAPSISFGFNTTTGISSSILNNLDLSTNGVARVRVDNSGNVGVGTTNPVTALDVVGVANVSSGYRIANAAASGNYLRGNGANFVSSAIQSTDVNSFISGNPNFLAKFTGVNSLGSSLIFDNGDVLGTSANVGVGITSPRNRLDVSGSVAFGSLPTTALPQANSAYFSGNVGVGTTNPRNALVIYGSVGIGNSVPADAPLQQNNMLFVSGNVGVGTTSPTQAVDVVGTIHASNLNGGATTLSTDANGNIIRTPSDVKLKENITPIAGALSKVLNLNGVYYEWRDSARFGSQQEVGFIAQEVQAVVPEVVRGGGDYLSLNYGNLTAVLAGAIKELNGKVDENGNFLSQAQAKGATLEERIQEAEKQIDTVNRQLGLKADLSQVVAGTESPASASPVSNIEALTVSRQSSSAIPVGSLVMPESDNTVGLAAANEPAKVLGAATEIKDDQVKVAILGVTRVLVATSSTQIKRGDLLTVTLESGKVNKAENGDYVVAKALEDVTQNGDVQAVLVPGYYFDSPNKLESPPPSASSLFTEGDSVKIDKNTVLYKDLNVLGKTTVGDLYATGRLAVGFLSLDSSDNSISSLGTELKLQSSTNAGNINIFGGKIMLMASGDVVTTGAITADKIKANELTVNKVNIDVLGASNGPEATSSLTPVKDPTIGSASIVAGQTSVQVASRAVTEKSLIFTTPDQPVAVGTKKGANSFTITIKEPLETGLTVNWWIIN